MRAVLDLLAERPLLLLFFVAALGFPLGRLKIGGAPFGTAMVLFVGLAVGALDPRLKLPDFVHTFGLALFIYCIGLTSAQGFAQAFSRDGLRSTVLAVVALVAAAGVSFAGIHFFGVPPTTGATMYSGALTNASGLASVVDSAQRHGASAATVAQYVLGYSLAYPLGILLPLLMMLLAPRAFRVDLKQEAQSIPEFRRASEGVGVGTVLVTRPEAADLTVAEAGAKVGAGVTFGRIAHESGNEIAGASARFRLGDRVTVVGGMGAIERAAHLLGELTEEHLERDRSEFELRRVFVSNPEIAGRALRDLNIPREYGAIVTRVKRGDLDLIPDGGTILQLGDRVRALARHEDYPKLARFLGDSYRALGEADLLPLSLGMLLGLLIGEIPIPLPDGAFRLGFAGGPLVAALILGRLQRTRGIVWQLPYPANLTLRQFGLSLFAAGIGLRAGYGFWSSVSRGEGFGVVLVGALATLTSAVVVLVGGRLVLKAPLNRLFGVYAGAQTQPIALSFALARTGNDIPTNEYAGVFPVAIVLKIVLAQILYAVLR